MEGECKPTCILVCDSDRQNSKFVDVFHYRALRKGEVFCNLTLLIPLQPIQHPCSPEARHKWSTKHQRKFDVSPDYYSISRSVIGAPATALETAKRIRISIKVSFDSPLINRNFKVLSDGKRTW